jgi:RNA exonuclease NGL2
LPILDKAGYSHRYAAGPGKKHGCVIAFKRQIFEQAFERVVFYDEQDIRDASEEKTRRGLSFKTRNLGLILALRYRHNPLHGVIVATTHLFWHPEFVLHPFYKELLTKSSQIYIRENKVYNNYGLISQTSTE